MPEVRKHFFICFFYKSYQELLIIELTTCLTSRKLSQNKQKKNTRKLSRRQKRLKLNVLKTYKKKNNTITITKKNMNNNTVLLTTPLLQWHLSMAISLKGIFFKIESVVVEVLVVINKKNNKCFVIITLVDC